MSANQKDVIPHHDAGALTSVIERAAANPDVDIEKMERLLNMQERMLGRQAETDFFNALTLAQSEIQRVHANLDNKQTRSKYASYGALDKVVRPIYVKHGFALSFDTGTAEVEAHIRILCNVSHRGGHCKTYHIDMPADGKGAKGGDVMTKTHATASGVSYGRRYLVMMIFNIAIGDDNDDDGNSAGGANLVEDLLTYNELVREHWDTLADVKRLLLPMWGEHENAPNVEAAREAFKELDQDTQRKLWRAPTKGGVLTTQERSLLHHNKPTGKHGDRG